jgi:hypothetical protein
MSEDPLGWKHLLEVVAHMIPPEVIEYIKLWLPYLILQVAGGDLMAFGCSYQQSPRFGIDLFSKYPLRLKVGM